MNNLQALSALAVMGSMGALDSGYIPSVSDGGLQTNPHQRNGRSGQKPGRVEPLQPPFKASTITDNGVPLSARQRREMRRAALAAEEKEHGK